MSLEAFGFYPAGGGEIVAEIEPLSRDSEGATRLRSFEVVERGELISVSGTAVAANLPAHIAQRMADRARNLLDRAGIKSDIRPRRVSSRGPGAGLFLIAHYENIDAGFSSLGKKGKPSEHVAKEAVDQMLKHHSSGMPIDPHLADQLMLPLLLASGPSRYLTSRVTQHQETHADLINLIYPGSVHIRPQKTGTGEVVVNPVDIQAVA
jgi:RNA 3'-terminal phosphate cyclase (ATP)